MKYDFMMADEPRWFKYEMSQSPHALIFSYGIKVAFIWKINAMLKLIACLMIQQKALNICLYNLHIERHPFWILGFGISSQLMLWLIKNHCLILILVGVFINKWNLPSFIINIPFPFTRVISSMQIYIPLYLWFICFTVWWSNHLRQFDVKWLVNCDLFLLCDWLFCFWACVLYRWLVWAYVTMAAQGWPSSTPAWVIRSAMFFSRSSILCPMSSSTKRSRKTNIHALSRFI